MAMDDSRKLIRNIEGTAPFQYKNTGGSVTASSVEIFDFDNDTPQGGNVIQVRPYLPLDELTISNNSGQAVDIFINQNDQKIKRVYNGTVITFKDSFFSLRLGYTATATVTAATIEISGRRVGATTDNLSKALARNVFSRALLGL